MGFAVFALLIIGVFLIVHGVYEDKYQQLKKQVKVEYRFVPRTYYEDQLFESQFKSKTSPMFDEDDQWYDRNVGREIGLDRKKIR
jgi:hypothetical protein